MTLDMKKWTLVIQQQEDKELEIDFESNYHSADVKKVARAVARNRGINLSHENVKYQVNLRQ